MKISACYIVKDCAEDFTRSLSSLSGFVDEIVVVDTGSTDDTVAVAGGFGAKVIHEPWADDFAAPRNVALDNATGDWIVFLDADEFFSRANAENLRFAVGRAEEFNQQAILVPIVNIDADAGNRIIDANYVLRIYKNLRGIRYVGRIHEELRLDGRNLTAVTTVPPEILTIHHTGYSAGINRAKAERNLRILLAELAETDNPRRIYGYIAETYEGLGDFASAEKFARLDVESGATSTRSYRIILKILAENPARAVERAEFARKTIDKFPALPEFSAELAEAYAANGDFLRAAIHMTDAIQKFKKYSGLEPTTFNAKVLKFAEQRLKLWASKL